MVPPRVSKAVRAMNGLGISSEKVKPVLKNLLKVYDNNWELIEEENYRVLADSIFDYQEQEVKKKQVEKFDTEEDQHEENCTNNSSELLTAKLRGQKDDDHSSNLVSNSGIMAGESSSKRRKLDDQACLRQENTEFVSPQAQSFGAEAIKFDSNQAHVRKESIEHVQPLTFDREKRIDVGSQKSNFKEQRVEPCLPQVAHRKKGLIREETTSQNCLKKPKVEADIDPLLENGLSNHNCSASVRHKSSPLGETPQFEVPIAAVPPDLSSIQKTSCSLEGDSTKERDLAEALASPYVDGADGRKGAPDVVCENGTIHDLGSIPRTSSEHIEIASSCSGEVKLSLICDCPVGRSNFHMPNLNLVLKAVEDQCLRSYKIVGPNFSVMKLMKELCQCFLELGTVSNHGEAEGEVNWDPSFSSLMKLNLKNVLGSTSNPFQSNSSVPASSSNGLPGEHQSSMALVPHVPRLLAPIGMDSPRGHTQQKRKTSVVSNSGRNKKKLKGTGLSIVSRHSLDIIPSCQLFLDTVSPLHDVNDISKGEERVRISIVNKVSSKCYPPSFFYIPQNIVYQNAYLNFSLARIGDENCCSDCFGDCLSSSIPCACARETGGEYAYTLDGRLRKEFLDECIFASQDPQKHHFFYCKDCPLERSKNEVQPDTCKGHLVRKFIKECWSKCGCNKQCGNRVVQRGITCNLQVFLTSEEKGWGVRTLEELPKGTFVCEYVGEVLTNMELYDRTIQITGNDRHTYPVLLDADWGSEGVLKDEDALCLDATFYGNVARFINHRCTDANLLEIPVEVETPDHHYYHLAFFTTRKVEAMEELSWDYGIDFDDHSHPVKAFQCCCGSKYCRDEKRDRSKRKALVLR